MVPISVARREFNRSPCASQVVRDNPSRFLRLETLEKPNNPAILHIESAAGKGFWGCRPKLLTFVRLSLALVCKLFPPRPERGQPADPPQQLATQNPPPHSAAIPETPLRHMPPPRVVDGLHIRRQGESVLVQQRQLNRQQPLLPLHPRQGPSPDGMVPPQHPPLPDQRPRLAVHIRIVGGRFDGHDLVVVPPGERRPRRSRRSLNGQRRHHAPCALDGLPSPSSISFRLDT